MRNRASFGMSGFLRSFAVFSGVSGFSGLSGSFRIFFGNLQGPSAAGYASVSATEQ